MKIMVVLGSNHLTPTQGKILRSDFGCGVSELHGKTLVTGAGLGTSLLPLRLFTQPEVWVVEVRAAER